MNAPAAPIRLHRMTLSGHSHRVELFLSLLRLPYETVEIDLLQGAHRQPGFLALNVFGQVPVIQDRDVTVADSNAILVYLEGRYAPGQWLPREPRAAAEVQRWFSAAAGPLAFGPAAARVIALFGRPDDPAPARARAKQLLQVMEQVLQAQRWLAGAERTLADVAMYSYVACAGDGGVALEDVPGVRRWLAQVEALPGFVPMPKAAAS